MRVIDDIATYSPEKGLCLTIGNFDGLHLGHQSLINRTREIAAKENLDFAVMTFWPHPRTVVHERMPHFPLADRADRLRMMESLNIPLVFELPFDRHMAAMSAKDFAAQILKPLSLSWLVIGYDFNMGHNRDGTAEVLKKLGKSCGFNLEQIPPYTIKGIPVSSSLLRQAILNGDMNTAREMLGRNYSVNGKIVHGKGRGRGLGYPTANLGNIHNLLPGNGVYACLAHIDGKTLQAATCIGTTPTFDGQETTVESFLLEGGEDIYGKDMRLEFIEKIRDQAKFASAEKLAEQIGLDIKKIKEILASHKA